MAQRKSEGGASGKGRGRKRKTAKSGAKKRRKKAPVKVEEPPAVIDPDLAVVIKRPVRVQIVALGHQRLISPTEFAEENGYPLDYISTHFRVLDRANFLELVEEVKVRGTVKHMYRSVKRAFLSDIDWSHLEKRVQDGVSGAFVQDLNGRLADAADSGTLNSRDDRCLFWIALTLDEISWPEFTKMMEWAVKEGRELGVDTVERHARGEGSGCVPVTFAVLGFESPKESGRKSRPTRRRESPPKGRKKKS